LLVNTIDVHAAKKKHHRQPQTKHLTSIERFCQYGGTIASAIIVDRDALVPLTTTVARLRILLAHDLRSLSGSERASITQEMVNLAYLFYTTTKLSPAEARYYFEVGCLNPNLTTTASPSVQQLWR
jgi:hypothetical protein